MVPPKWIESLLRLAPTLQLPRFHRWANGHTALVTPFSISISLSCETFHLSRRADLASPFFTLTLRLSRFFTDTYGVLRFVDIFHLPFFTDTYAEAVSPFYWHYVLPTHTFFLRFCVKHVNTRGSLFQNRPKIRTTRTRFCSVGDFLRRRFRRQTK